MQLISKEKDTFCLSVMYIKGIIIAYYQSYIMLGSLLFIHTLDITHHSHLPSVLLLIVKVQWHDQYLPFHTVTTHPKTK